MEASEEDLHRGTFAEGQERQEHHPEREAGPRFSRGQEEGGAPEEEDAHRGTFAEGQERQEHHPEREAGPRFSRGQEESEPAQG